MEKKDVKGYAKEYADLPFEDVQVRYRNAKIIEILNRFPHRTILEVGCGLHSIFEEFSDFNRMVVIEPASEFCQTAIASRSQKGFDSKVDIVEGFVEESREVLAKNQYDFIIMSELMNEVENPAEVLNSVHKLCNSKTVVHVNVTNAKSFHRLLAKEMGLIDSEYAISDQQKRLKQKLVYDLDALKILVQKHGFKVIEEGSYFVKPFSHKQMQELTNSGILPKKFLDGLDGMIKYMPGLGSEIYVNLQIE